MFFPLCADAEHGDWRYHILSNGDWGPVGQIRVGLLKVSGNMIYEVSAGNTRNVVSGTPDSGSLANNWHFVAGTCRNAGTNYCMVYFDGNVIGENTNGFSSASAVPARFTIGARADALGAVHHLHHLDRRGRGLVSATTRTSDSAEAQ